MNIGDFPKEYRTAIPDIAFCEEKQHRLEVFFEAVQQLVMLHEQQSLAIIKGDEDFSRFDLLIHMAIEKKQQAKYAYLRHVETHGCI
jgi:hypothetical protein